MVVIVVNISLVSEALKIVLLMELIVVVNGVVVIKLAVVLGSGCICALK